MSPTSFDYTGTDNNGDLYLKITDPLGEQEEAVFTQPQTPGDGSDPPIPAGILGDDPFNTDRNTFFWSKKAMADDSDGSGFGESLPLA